MEQTLIDVAERTVSQDNTLVEQFNKYFTCCIFSIIISLIITGFVFYIYGISFHIE